MCNFFAGQGKLSAGVLKWMQQELLDYNGSGLFVIEGSHRSEPTVGLLAPVQDKLKLLLKLPSGPEVLLLKGGGLLPFLW
jgi:phosphoserine aminotransferase